jgi:hypothetical protein
MTDVSAHEATSSAALTANATGTNVAGEIVRSPRELAMTSRIENAAVAITIAGNVVTSRLAR